MRVSITHTVPVVVIVDTETGDVDRVVVIDEEIRVADDAEVYEADSWGTPAPIDEALKAMAIVKADDIMWPSWNLGW